jgi:hypothetical protein
MSLFKSKFKTALCSVLGNVLNWFSLFQVGEVIISVKELLLKPRMTINGEYYLNNGQANIFSWE